MDLLTTFEAAEKLRSEWQGLAEAVGADIFATFDWCATWWKHFSAGRQLRIFAFWRDDELAAIFPLFRETIRWGPLSLRVVRVLGSDHAGTRCWPLFKTQHLGQVLKQLLPALSRDGAWDLVHIGDLPGYFGQVAALITELQESNAGSLYVNRNYYPHGVFNLPLDFEEYLESLSGNERNNIRKNERRLSKTHKLRSVLSDPGECEHFLNEFVQWHDDYWKSQNELGFFTLWPGSQDFHSEFARIESATGQTMLLRVFANDDPVGNVYAHRFGNRVHLFQAVRAPGNSWDSFGPGRLLHCELFRHCMAQGINQVDAMSGFYEYKRRLGAQFVGLTTLALVNHSFASRFNTRLFQAFIYVVNLAYFRCWLCKLTPYIRRITRSKNRFLHAGMARKFIRSRFILAALGGRRAKTDSVEHTLE